MSTAREAQDYGPLLLRLLPGALFVAHLYWKVAILPGGVAAWWNGLVQSGYPALVPAYVLSAEILGALLLIPGVQTRWVALYAMPMMAGAAEFWLAPTGFYFTKSGAELPLVWLALLCLQIVLGDGAFALVKSAPLLSLSIRRVQLESSGQAWASFSSPPRRRAPARPAVCREGVVKGQSAWSAFRAFSRSGGWPALSAPVT